MVTLSQCQRERYNKRYTEGIFFLKPEESHGSRLVRLFLFYPDAVDQTINIPMNIMKRYRSDKSLWELFVFAVCIKMTSGDSRISADIKAVRRLMGCSYYKAVRMVEEAKRCPDLFYVYQNGKHIVARSFTHGRLEKRIHRTRKKEYTAYCASCIRFRYDPGSVRHIKVSRELRDTLITDAIMATHQTDGSNPIKHSFRPSDSRPITLQTLASVSGYHYTTVLKHIQKMEESRKVATVKGERVSVLHLETGEVLTDNEALLNRKVWYDWHGLRFVREPNRYTIVNPDRSDHAVNIIFNHRNRHRRNVSANPRQKQGESHGDYLNRTVLAYLWN